MVNLEIRNKIESFLNSRTDWSNPKFRELVLERFKLNNNEFNLQDIKLRGKIEDLYNYFHRPEKYDENGKLKNSIEIPKSSQEKHSSSLGFLEDPIKNQKEIKKTKPNILTINDYSELISAIKCLLWSFDNTPKTSKDLLSHIMIHMENGIILPLLDSIEGNEYTESNNAFNMAISMDLLHLHKIRNKNGWVFLYYNPTDKRQGYFYKGQLWKLKDLSEINNVKMGTIQRRFQKMSIENSIK
jgi:hypothetical protein